MSYSEYDTRYNTIDNNVPYFCTMKVNTPRRRLIHYSLLLLSLSALAIGLNCFLLSEKNNANNYSQPNHHERSLMEMLSRRLADATDSFQSDSQHPPGTTATYTTAASTPARFLFGIFTIAEERARRTLIRKAFAMYNDTRVCPFGSFYDNNNHLPPVIAPECEILYTFVMGANPQGDTQIVLNSSSERSDSGGGGSNSNRVASTATATRTTTPLLTTAPPPDFDATLEPNDITYLNIKENMNLGKTPTWFHYASTQVMKPYDVDYVIKCDSDTYIKVDVFFDIARVMLPRGRGQTYGGYIWSYPNHHVYMAGQFYLMSRDLAELVASVSLNHTKDVEFIEDSDVGLVLLKHRQKLTHLISMERRRPWYHPLKKETLFHRVTQVESMRLGKTPKE